MTRIGRLSLPPLSKFEIPRLKAKAAEHTNMVPPATALRGEEHSGCLGERGLYLKMCCIHLHMFMGRCKQARRYMSSMGSA